MQVKSKKQTQYITLLKEHVAKLMQCLFVSPHLKNFVLPIRIIFQIYKSSSISWKTT